MMSEAPSSPLLAGRPRNPQIDRAVLAAARDLLVERGYADLTLAAIAERAGTTRPALYRRWPTKAHLVREAAFGDRSAALKPSTGDLATDLRGLIEATAETLSGPAARAALPGLLLETARDAELQSAILTFFRASSWQPIKELIGPYVVAGEVRADLDLDVVIEMLAGSVLIGLLVRNAEPLGEDWIDSVLGILLKGLRP